VPYTQLSLDARVCLADSTGNFAQVYFEFVSGYVLVSYDSK